MENNNIDDELARQILSETLGFYKYKVDNNLCMMPEIYSAANALLDNMDIYGGIKDFAEHYGKSEDAIRSLIKRRMVGKPKRNIVMYPFHKFRKIVPVGWRKH